MDFTGIGFKYHKTNANFISVYENGTWGEGKLQSEDTLTISAFSPALHYGQQAFEGLKAYRTKEGKVQLFRPDLNAKRFQNSCERLLMPSVTIATFINACQEVVRANEEFIPPHGSGATLYLRPYMIGVGMNLGVRPAEKYIFGVLASPVGSYFKTGLSPLPFVVTDYDRAAPNGTGKQKVGGNYAASLYPNHIAHELGYADCIYLDPLTHTKIDEAGAANFFGITKDNHFVTPKSSSILPSITRISLEYIASHYLGMEVEERDVYIDNLDEFSEACACGTAAVITPIGRIDHHNVSKIFYSETEVGPYSTKLYELLTKMQWGDIEAPPGWIFEIQM